MMALALDQTARSSVLCLFVGGASSAAAEVTSMARLCRAIVVRFLHAERFDGSEMIALSSPVEYERLAIRARSAVGRVRQRGRPRLIREHQLCHRPHVASKT